MRKGERKPLNFKCKGWDNNNYYTQQEKEWKRLKNLSNETKPKVKTVASRFNWKRLLK